MSMFTLKLYQRQTLDALTTFLARARISDPASAFAHFVAENPTERRPQRYRPAPKLENVPHVCLRLPTGGGKTYLAAHSVGIAAREYMDRDFPLVLWLVPTNTIRQQTVEALGKATHPCHQTLTRDFGQGNVAVFDIGDVNNIRPKDLTAKVCVVVATYQTLRVAEENKDSRKVYGHNENFEPHFQGLPNVGPLLDRDAEGHVLYSFVNLLHQLRPLIIADEAHKAVSKLSKEVLQRINPACILEFSATPVESNVLYRVYASQLKAEEMVKLPFVLTEHSDWVQALNGAVQTRKRLEAAAAGEGEYVRPILLIQAEARNLERTVDVVRTHLVENEGVAESEIAIATGDQRGLDKVNLFDKTCPVRYIITIEALKEGWDCSFAYVFCSVANIRSDVDVEQLLGRVMRMPYARKRRIPELNKAYAHVISPSFAKAADEMCGHFMNMGFNEDEAAAYIEQPLLPGVDQATLPLLAQPPVLELTLAKAPDLSRLDEEDRRGVQVRPGPNGGVIIHTEAAPSEALEAVLIAADPKNEYVVRRSVALHRERVQRHKARTLTPAERGEVLRVPQLRLEIFGGMEEPEPQAILIASGWTPLLGFDGLEDGEFRYDESAKTFIFDLQGDRMVFHAAEAQEQYSLLAGSGDWDERRLVRWLDEQCRLDEVTQPDMLEFCRRAVASLLGRGGYELPVLCRAKFVLAAVLKAKLDRLRMEGLKKGHELLLLSPQAKVEVGFRYVHQFPSEDYAESAPAYVGHYAFQKHFYRKVRDLDHKGEEYDCARIIDLHPKVKWWVRNVDRKPGSFWLPLSSGKKFYPDFVAQLEDGRIMVAEYKGAHLKENQESEEKRNIGEFWAAKSQGKAVFVWATRFDQGRDTQAQLDMALR